MSGSIKKQEVKLTNKDEIDFNNNDVIIDCGANVGELNLAIEAYGKKINYFGFEPDKATFNCLSKNNPENKIRIITKYGNIDILLYENTEYHRANFIYLTKINYFENSMFHRVVKDFIINIVPPLIRRLMATLVLLLKLCLKH